MLRQDCYATLTLRNQVIRGVLRVFHGVELVAVENYEFK